MRFSSRFKHLFFLIALAGTAYLAFNFWRAQRLLNRAASVAARSESFSRDYFVGTGPTLNYLAMGDSTAAGWGAESLKATYPHQVAQALAARGFRVHVVNVAVGGATMQQVRQNQSAALQTVRPDLITLSAGANDATRRTSNQDFRRELRALWADLEKSSARTILVSNVPDMRFAPALPLPVAELAGKSARALNAELNGELQGLLRPSKIHIVDLFGRGKLDYQSDATLYAADLFHPSSRGYALWAPLFIQQLKNAKFETLRAR